MPSLLDLMDGNSYPTDNNSVLRIPRYRFLGFFVIELTTNAVTHPIHLHGHDFYILSQGTGTFNSSTSNIDINFTNPMRHNIAMLLASGHFVFAFLTDNPSIWLMSRNSQPRYRVC
ncbi:hypothetical protein RUND412_003367 [Rhizina undulata]